MWPENSSSELTPVNKGMTGEPVTHGPGSDVRDRLRTSATESFAVQIPRSCFFLASKSSLVMMP